MNTAPTEQEGFFFGNRWRGQPYLISAFFDFLMIGGGALLALGAFSMMSAERASALPLASMTVWLSLIVNYPHFMFSYQLLYHGYRRKLTTLPKHGEVWWRYVNAGIISPLILFLLLSFTAYDALAHNNYRLLGISFSFASFFVGWHYVKQSFGTFMVLSALRKTYYSASQRRLLLVNAYLIWLYAWCVLRSSQGVGLPSVQNLPGLTSMFIVMPHWLEHWLGMASLASGIGVAFMLTRAWMKEGKRPHPTAIIAYSSMYYLYGLSTSLNIYWAFFIPFFHSLQYMLFVVTYRRGHYRKAVHELKQRAQEDARMAKEMKRISSRHEMFYGLSFLFGLLGFILIPYLADGMASSLIKGAKVEIFLNVFMVFINIHHYFIDNAIWRKENSDVGEYLYKWSR